MSESMLMALMRLFAILANINKDISYIVSRNFVEGFLKTQFNKKIVSQSLMFYDAEIKKLSSLAGKNETKKTSLLSVKILSICNVVNRELPVRNKFLIIISLVQFSKYFESRTDPSLGFRQTIYDTIKTISDYMKIDEKEFINTKVFLTDKFFNVPDMDRLLVISNLKTMSYSKINHLQKDDLNGQLFFLKNNQANLIIFYYSGDQRLLLRGETIIPGHIYFMGAGSTLRAENMIPVHLSDIEAAFLQKKNVSKISYVVENIEFKYSKGKGGIHPLSFAAESGNFIGIMGGSGTGKSTLLKILTGMHKPKKGRITLNGHELYSPGNNLKGLVGYVPQDDLLIEELTVYLNLFYNAKLCLGNLETQQVEETVYRVLNQLDLFFIKDLQVGSAFNRYISGGQRKRLNIALELIKEPYILFVDEPTTGLSSRDSENVMQLLKELTMQGKIIVVTIHQPSSSLFKMLDILLVLDKGGYPAYWGNPLDSISYFKRIVNRIDSQEIECPYCGNVYPEEILEVIEAKQVNEYGEYTPERMIIPEKWYEFYIRNFSKTGFPDRTGNEIPPSRFSIPGLFIQFLTYSKRNLRGKLADKQYVLFSLLLSPFLAIVLSFITKYFIENTGGTFEYKFINNVNIPAYMFMSVIVALFNGLIISGEEIFKDRKILEREKFLLLSRAAYLNSKVTFLIVLTAIQSFLFVMIGNNILEIKGMIFYYWLILFSTGCFAFMLGLNISSSLRSAVAIYITIPFILVPLILLAGVIVKYDKLHYSLSSTEHTPLVGDLMASRWAYEALMVNQFKKNEYEKHFYTVDREYANDSWKLNFLIPELYNKINDFEQVIRKDKDTTKAMGILSLIRRTLKSFDTEIPQNRPISDEPDDITEMNLNGLMNILTGWRTQLIERTNSLTYRKDGIIEGLRKRGMTKDDLIKTREKYYNNSVADLVLNTNEMKKITEIRGRLLQKDTPVYQVPKSRYGRAHFYSGIKRIGPFEIDTFWFNTLVIWLMTFLLYFFLIANLFRKLFALSPGLYQSKEDQT